ncbi:hypothetical protein EV682_10987 [Iodobacter fluviatilis]|uniref:Uncharacterized protein n=1 Tax=Iodobacter fluviatilis TaxID=537 RepID=A0A377Q5J2_9NEIS|nr:hypothetical protein EV682_10987 [Iodobacter fluviatilis]STQ90028.1 Uncharacterised protein [Iodobacter fluviatilis]
MSLVSSSETGLVVTVKFSNDGWTCRGHGLSVARKHQIDAKSEWCRVYGSQFEVKEVVQFKVI